MKRFLWWLQKRQQCPKNRKGSPERNPSFLFLKPCLTNGLLSSTHTCFFFLFSLSLSLSLFFFFFNLFFCKREYYGISDDFPANQLMARGEGSPRIYFVSPAVRELLWDTSDSLKRVFTFSVYLFCFVFVPVTSIGTSALDLICYLQTQLHTPHYTTHPHHMHARMHYPHNNTTHIITH